MNDVVVLGATGNVGRAVVRELLDRQQPVMAVARNHQRLDALRADMSSSLLASVPVDMSDDRALTQLANDRAVGTPPRAVVVALNSWAEPRPMLEWTAASLLESLHANLVSHLNAARAFLPLLLAPDGVFLSVGGGTADHLVPGSAHSSADTGSAPDDDSRDRGRGGGPRCTREGIAHPGDGPRSSGDVRQPTLDRGRFSRGPHSGHDLGAGRIQRRGARNPVMP